MMQLMESSAISTSNLEDFSDRAFGPNLTKSWSLSQSKPRIKAINRYPMITLHWARESSDGDLQHSFSFKFTDSSTSATAPLYKRLFAHLVLDALPDTALDELLESLSNAWAFHQPAVPEIPEPAKIRKGKVTRRYERPTYSIED